MILPEIDDIIINKFPLRVRRILAKRYYSPFDERTIPSNVLGIFSENRAHEIAMSVWGLRVMDAKTMAYAGDAIVYHGRLEFRRYMNGATYTTQIYYYPRPWNPAGDSGDMIIYRERDAAKAHSYDTGLTRSVARIYMANQYFDRWDYLGPKLYSKPTPHEEFIRWLSQCEIDDSIDEIPFDD